MCKYSIYNYNLLYIIILYNIHNKMKYSLLFYIFHRETSWVILRLELYCKITGSGLGSNLGITELYFKFIFQFIKCIILNISRWNI